LYADVADEIGMEWLRGNLHGDKASSVIFDNTKIKRFVPGFNCTIPFRQGSKKPFNGMMLIPPVKLLMSGIIN
jgi:hypothetical protein